MAGKYDALAEAFVSAHESAPAAPAPAAPAPAPAAPANLPDGAMAGEQSATGGVDYTLGARGFNDAAIGRTETTSGSIAPMSARTGRMIDAGGRDVIAPQETPTDLSTSSPAEAAIGDAFANPLASSEVPPSKYDGIVRADAIADQPRVVAALLAAKEADPKLYERAAKVIGNDGTSALPAELVARNIDTFERQEKLRQVREILTENPQLADWMNRDANGKTVTPDELRQASNVGWILRAGGAAIASSWETYQDNGIRYRQMMGDATPEEVALADRDEARNAANPDAAKFGADSWMQRGWVGAAGSALPMLAQFAQGGRRALEGGAIAAAAGFVPGAVAGGVVAGPAGAVVGGAGTAFAAAPVGAQAGYVYGQFEGVFKQQAGMAWNEYRSLRGDDGHMLDPEVAKGAALVTGAIEAGINTWGIQKLIPGLATLGGGAAREAVKAALKNPTTRDTIVNLGKSLAHNASIMTLMPVLTEASRILVGEQAKQIDGGSIAPVDAGAAAERLLEAGKAGLETATILGPLMAIPGVRNDLRAVKQSEANQKVYAAIVEAARADDLAKRLPNKAQDLIATLKDESGIKELLVPPDKLQEVFQTKDGDGWMDNLAKVMPDIREQFDEATATNGDVKIPIEVAYAHLLDRYGDELAPHVRMERDGLTPFEAATRGDAIRATMEVLKNEEATRATIEGEAGRPANEVFKTVRDQLMNAGVAPDHADHYAMLHGAFFRVLGDKMGKSAKELFDRYGFSVERHFPEVQGYKKVDAMDVNLGAMQRFAKAVLADRAGFSLKSASDKRTNLLDWLVKRGGLHDEGGELSARDVKGYKNGRLMAKQDKETGRYLNKDGSVDSGHLLGLDTSALDAWQAGFFPELSDRPTVNEFLAAIDDGLSGSHRFNISEEEAARPGSKKGSAFNARQGEMLKQMIETSPLTLEEMASLSIPELRTRLEAHAAREQVATEDQHVLDTRAHDPAVAKEIDDFLDSIGEGRELFQFAGAGALMDDAQFAGATRFFEGEKAGKDPDELWAETGFFRGTDGHLRFEISDVDSKIKPSVEHVLSVGQMEYKDALGGLFDHPHLFEAYPQLRGVRVTLESGTKRGGVYDPNNNTIEARGPNLREVRSVLLHEIAHAIQQIEGFATGGNLSMGELYEGKAVNAWAGEISRIKRLAIEATDRMAPLHEGDPKLDNLRASFKELEERLATAEMEMQKAAKYEFYHRIAGEVEARNVQKRDEERQSNRAKEANAQLFDLEGAHDLAAKLRDRIIGEDAPVWTQDVPNDQQIIIAVSHDGQAARMAGIGDAGFGAYLDKVNPGRKRVADGERPNLSIHDMAGMAPKGSVTIAGATKNVEGVGVVTFVRDKNGNVYAKALNPETGERDVVGYAMAGKNSTELAVGNEMQGKGIGSELQYQFRKANPDAPTGGLTEAGERTLRKTYDRLQAEGALDKPRELYQGKKDGQDVRRGSLQIMDGEHVVNLFEQADLSTFLHETGHFFLEVYKDLALKGDMTPELRADWEKLSAYLGIKGDEAEIPTVAHETFARTFEAWLFEGKAPNAELATAFSRFKAWLGLIYRKISSLGVTPNDEIRGVMDRMLASDAEIDAQIKSPEYRTMDETLGLMNPRERKAYVELVEAAKEAAREKLIATTLAEVKRETTKAWRDLKRQTHAEVADEYSQIPVYQAVEFLRTGKFIGHDGDRFAGVPHMRLDKNALLEMFGPGILSKLPKAVPPLFSDKNGVHPDIVAEMFGFRSGHEMVEQMMSSPPFRRAISDEVTARMKDRHGDLMNDQASLSAAAVDALHEADRAPILRAEYEALTRKAGGTLTRTPLAMLRETAREIIGRKSVAEGTRIGTFDAQEARAARRVEDALLAGDFDTAAQWKEKQLFAHVLAQEARRAERDVQSARDYLAKFTKPKPVSGVDGGYLEQINGILERFDLRKVSADKRAREQRAALQDFLDAEQLAGEMLSIPDELKSDAFRQHFRDMGVDDFRALKDTIKNLEHVGRLKNKLIVKGKQVAFETARDEFVAAVRASQGERKVRVNQSMGPKEKIADTFSKWDAGLLKIEQLVNWIDNGNVNGPFHRYVWEPIKVARMKEMDRLIEYNAKILDVMGALPKGRLEERFNIKSVHPDFHMTRAEIFSVGLNMGTESNLSKMKRGGNQYGEFTDAHLADMTAHLSKEDWQAIDKVWKIVGSLWPEIAAQQKRMTGIEPEKVEARKVTTKHGVFEGGYFPLVYDSTMPGTLDVARREDLKTLFPNASPNRPSTANGFTKARVENYARPIKLDLQVIPEHLKEVIHDLSFRETLRDAFKLLNDKQVTGEIERRYGRHKAASLFPWLQAIAADGSPVRVNEAIDKLAAAARTNATIFGIGYRFSTIIAQISGLIPSMNYVSPMFLAKGMREYYGLPGSAEKVREFVYAKSGEMKHREASMERDIGDTIRRVVEGKGVRKTGDQAWISAAMQEIVHGDFKGAKADVLKFAFHGIGWMDRNVAIPTWLGAYREHLAKNPNDEAGAVANGDRAVRMSQGSGNVEDLAAVSRGTEVGKMFTQFYSYWSAFYAQARDLARDASNAGVADVPKLLARAFFIWAAPAVMSDVLTGKGPDEDKDETWAGFAMKKILLYPLMAIPGIRDAAGSWDSGRTSVSPSAIGRILEAVGHAGQTIGKAASGGEVDRGKSVRHLIDATGLVFGLPIGQVGVIAQNIFEDMDKNGGQISPRDLLFPKRH